jgi:uncharacterized membrane protein
VGTGVFLVRDSLKSPPFSLSLARPIRLDSTRSFVHPSIFGLKKCVLRRLACARAIDRWTDEEGENQSIINRRVVVVVVVVVVACPFSSLVVSGFIIIIILNLSHIVASQKSVRVDVGRSTSVDEDSGNL